MRSIAVRFVALSIFWTAACTVGPDYKRPLVTIPVGYRGAASADASATSVASLGDEKWWDVFQDDQLRNLMTIAVRQNLDVRIAAARVLQAQALLGIVRADQFPTVQGGAGSARDRQAESLKSAAVETSALQVGVAAAWELDFWGKFRRATEAAQLRCLFVPEYFFFPFFVFLFGRSFLLLQCIRGCFLRSPTAGVNIVPH